MPLRIKPMILILRTMMNNILLLLVYFFKGKRKILSLLNIGIQIGDYCSFRMESGLLIVTACFLPISIDEYADYGCLVVNLKV